MSSDIFGRHFIGCWNEGGNSFLFFSRQHDEEVRTWLGHQGGGKLVSRHVMDYRDWQAGEDLKPFRIEKLRICPSWEEADIAEDEILIRLDPGVVFGTGLHPTTRGCLKALWRIYQVDCPRKVLDIGTGTGILAISAAKLGAREVLAIDYNELAVETARRNVLLNGVEGRVRVAQGEAERMDEDEADMVLANLHFNIIDVLVRRGRCFSRRWVVLSGLFHGQVSGTLASLERWQLKVYNRMEENPWVTLVLRKTPFEGGSRYGKRRRVHR